MKADTSIAWPRSLLFLLALTVMSVSALGWLGWRLVSQEEMVAAQRQQEQLEQSADRLVALSRGRLAELGQQLSEWMVRLPNDARLDNGLFLVRDGNNLTPFPPARLLYRPNPRLEPEAPADVFGAAERLEFRGGSHGAAVEAYRALARSPNLPVRAGALMRLARVHKNAGQTAQAIAAYEGLASIRNASVAGVPADLVGLHAMADFGKQPNAIHTVRDGLLQGRWMLDRGQFSFYWSEIGRLNGLSERAPALALTDTAYDIMARWNSDLPSTGQETKWSADIPVVSVWRMENGRLGMLVLDEKKLIQEIAKGETSTWAAIDLQGRVLAGNREGEGRAHIRPAADTDLPWSIYVRSSQAHGATGNYVSYLRLALALMLLSILTGSWFIARAIRRELEVSRLQSDFVAGVSHEFRSPLSSMRQLSEMLMLGRVPNEQRRQEYYETLVGETGRLQRLVESLLNFGGMEAGVKEYSFKRMNMAELAKATTEDFEPQVARGRIELSGNPECLVDADREALQVALRNLMDNALKYSKGVVRVEWNESNGQVEVRVKDEGAGIPPREQQVIFQKFVRGSVAKADNVKGTGVGLAMVRHIVTAHNGGVKVESVPGIGSTFTLWLPQVHSV